MGKLICVPMLHVVGFILDVFFVFHSKCVKMKTMYYKNMKNMYFMFTNLRTLCTGMLTFRNACTGSHI